MDEQLITFETAKLAKEKGFNFEEQFTYSAYNDEGKLGNSFKSDGIYDILAPSQSLFQKWLREKHKIMVYVFPMYLNRAIGQCEHTGYCYYLDGNNYDEYDTYEEALEKGLFEAIKLIK